MSYYVNKLSGNRLRECYDIAPKRVKQYLKEEIKYVADRLKPTDVVLELGCGYGRIANELAETALKVVGIDTAKESISLAKELYGSESRCEFKEMDATSLLFRDKEFDTVICLQNGICAFRVDQSILLKEAIRVTRSGGNLFFSSYSDRFWSYRLKWFEIQAEHGLLGEIDYDATGNGIIATKDGFRSGAMSVSDFKQLFQKEGLVPKVTEIDGSFLICECMVP